LDIRLEEIPLGSPAIREFVKFPWRLYRGDPCWTPPLNAELLGNRLLGITGLLTPRHVYHRHAEVTHFLAKRGSETVGRITAAVNRRYNDYHKTSIGFFGFFEVTNDYAVAASLLDRARDWVKSRGMTVLRGPGEYSNATHERQGVLIDGFQYPPTFDCTHNPPYYGEFIEKYGFRKAKDYHAWAIDILPEFQERMKALAVAMKQRRHFETRAGDISRAAEEVRLMASIYNDAWSENWGFLPILDEEVDGLVSSLKTIADPGLFRFAMADGKPAAVMAILPDPNVSLRPRWKWFGDSDMVRLALLISGRKRIKNTRLFFYGITKPYRNWGIGLALGAEILEYLSSHGYRTSEASLVLEDNTDTIGPLLEFLNAKRYKTWRIYDLPL
jgi:GNAT superfamily N-acetyltransferase